MLIEKFYSSNLPGLLKQVNSWLSSSQNEPYNFTIKVIPDTFLDEFELTIQYYINESNKKYSIQSQLITIPNINTDESEIIDYIISKVKGKVIHFEKLFLTNQIFLIILQEK